MSKLHSLTRRYWGKDVSSAEYRYNSHHLGSTNSFAQPPLILLREIGMGPTEYFTHLGDEWSEHGGIHRMLERVYAKTIEGIFKLGISL